MFVSLKKFFDAVLIPVRNLFAAFFIIPKTAVRTFIVVVAISKMKISTLCSICIVFMVEKKKKLIFDIFFYVAGKNTSSDN